MRVRAAIAALSMELLGGAMTLVEFPVLKGIRGIGMSDSPQLAERLAQKLDYTNTFYDQAPRFDVTTPDPNDFGRYDFILSSEVMEHVPPPVEPSFANLFHLLKPDGLLIMTTPYSKGGKTKEHFPELGDFTLASLGGETVLINRRRDGSIEVFEDLVFHVERRHGRAGSTVEMRLFSEESLRENLLAAGFSSVRVASENAPEFGVDHSEAISLPMVALKGKFIPPAAELAREYRDAHRLAVHHEGQLKILRNEYERYAAHHEAWHKETARELDKRYEWGAQLQRKLTELEKELMVRTEWALGLDREIADLRQRVAELKEEHARLEARKWMRVGRRLGAID